MTVNYFETINILLFNNAFKICSIIILTSILCLNLSALDFKFKTGLHIIIFYQLLLATVRGEGLLRMIPSVYLFTNVPGINQ